jgi:hypothetical protein
MPKRGKTVHKTVTTTVPYTQKGTGSRQLFRDQLAANKDHRATGRVEIRFVDPMTFFLFHYHRSDVSLKILVTRTLTQKQPQIMIFLTE